MATFPPPPFTLTRSLVIPVGMIGGESLKIVPGLSFKPKFTLTTDWWWLDGRAWCAELGDTFGQASLPTIGGPDSALICQNVFIAANGVQVAFQMTGGTPGTVYTFTPLLTTNINGNVFSDEIMFPILSSDSYVPNTFEATNAGVPLFIGGIPFPVGG
jgi:hypothetical protein